MINEDRQLSSVRIDISSVLRPFDEERKHLENLRQSTNVESILLRLFDLLKVDDYRILLTTINRNNLTRKSLQLFSELCMKRYLESDQMEFRESTRSLPTEGHISYLFDEFRSHFSIEYFHLIIGQFEQLNKFKIEQIYKCLKQNDLLVEKLFRKIDDSVDDSVIHLRSTAPIRPIYVKYQVKHTVQPQTKVLFLTNDNSNSNRHSMSTNEGLTMKFISDFMQSKTVQIFEKKSSKILDIEKRFVYFVENCDEKTILPLKLRVLVRNRCSGKYQIGLVAEEPAKNNQYRCLLFFYDQNQILSAFYHSPSDIHVCFDQKQTIDDFDRDREFLQSYFENYPERMMLRVREGTQIKVQMSNNSSAVVLQIDCSMMLIELSQTKEQCWIYRGSTQIDQLKTFYSTQNKDLLRHSARQHLSARKSNAPEVICSNDELNRVKRARLSFEQKTLAITQPSQSKLTIDPIFHELTQEFLLHYNQDFHPHICSTRCVTFGEKYFHQLPRTMNPFLKPFACGWTVLENLRIRKCNDVRVKTQRPIIIYCAPCGRKLCNETQVDQYLEQTRSKLTIELFVFDCAINLKQCFQSAGRVISSDISNGLENVPIPLVNEIDDDEPQKFTYRVERTPVKGVNLMTYEPTMTCCNCTDGCRNRTQCACWLKTLKYAELIGDDRVKSMKAKNKTQAEILYQLGYGFRRLHKNVPGGIYECNDRCACQQETCSNRVVQNGVIAQLQLFKTPLRGWGVRTLYDLPMGTFISVYSGEIFTSEQADERGKQIGDEYQADLDFFENINQDEDEDDENESDDESAMITSELDDAVIDEDENRSPIGLTQKRLRSSTVQLRSRESQMKKLNKTRKNSPAMLNRTNLPDYDGTVYTLDAKLIGNIGRYFNHSCSPNIAVQNVFVDTHDIHFPWIGFFTTKIVRAGTELCWDYNYTVGEIQGRRMDCNCGSSECRRRML